MAGVLGFFQWLLQETYDAKGNLTRNIDGDSYAWDSDNQLIGANTDGLPGNDVSFSYDALGRRVSRTEGGSSVIFVSITHPLPTLPYAGQVVAEYFSGSSNSLSRAAA